MCAHGLTGGNVHAWPHRWEARTEACTCPAAPAATATTVRSLHSCTCAGFNNRCVQPRARSACTTRLHYAHIMPQPHCIATSIACVEKEKKRVFHLRGHAVRMPHPHSVASSIMCAKKQEKVRYISKILSFFERKYSVDASFTLCCHIHTVCGRTQSARMLLEGATTAATAVHLLMRGHVECPSPRSLHAVAALALDPSKLRLQHETGSCLCGLRARL